MVTAAIGFTQGALVSAPGVALIGVKSVEVTCANGDNSGVVSRLWTLKSVPIDSALVAGTTAVTETFAFTPDVDHAYLVRLVVTAADGSVAIDERAFGVPNADGCLVPAFQGAGAAHNFAGNARGWAGTESVKMVDWLLNHGSLPLVTTISVSIFYVTTSYPQQIGGTILHSEILASDAQSWSVEVAYRSEAESALTFTIADADTETVLGTVTCTPSEVPAIADIPLNVSSLDLTQRHMIAILSNHGGGDGEGGLCIGALLIGRPA